MFVVRCWKVGWVLFPNRNLSYLGLVYQHRQTDRQVVGFQQEEEEAITTMSMTEFAMVEELASLIKDNLSSKHLILSVEQALLHFLHTSQDGILELEPMTPYNRLLLHRLADIFGLAHESVGEGDDRHLILERCPESSIPSILVSDILWQCIDYQSPAKSHHLLRRKEVLTATKENPKSYGTTLEEREAAYLAARERIFSMDEIKDSGPPKPRNVPVVARRMIAHALGQRIRSNSSNMKVNIPDSDENDEERIEELSPEEKSLKTMQETSSLSSQKMNSYERKKDGQRVSNASSSASRCERKPQKKFSNTRASNDGAVRTGGSANIATKDSLKQEHMGAAKRIFAHALGFQGLKDINGIMLKCKEEKAIEKQ